MPHARHALSALLGPGLWVIAQVGPSSFAPAAPPAYFEIEVLDRDTGRGIPLVELTTVHNVTHVTDNAGRIAYPVLGRAGQEIHFTIRAQGYRVPEDGFGFAGKRFHISTGGSAKLRLERVNLAERLYRCTGQDLYRDSILLGHETPLRRPHGSGRVAGQDSIQAAIYRDKIRWFWGDTNRLSYPLGLFRTAGAVSELPARGGLHPSRGIDYIYFTNADGFARAMADVSEKEGVVWIDGLCVVKDKDGHDRMVAHFSRRKGLAEELEHGLLVYDNEGDAFQIAAPRPLDRQWSNLAHHPVRIDKTHLGFGGPFPVTRVPAEFEAVLDPARYESYSCRDPGGREPRRTKDGKVLWRWQGGPATTQKDEWAWLQKGVIKPEETRLLPVDAADPNRRVLMHHGTVRWNPWRNRWIMIATESATAKGSPSFLGEVWYSE
ncbi:MAG: hypothetical protein GWO24_28600, partial [Akkermansiaceae bacterium]|nr:hypothetical protein [Akkermansiaceae bacterium]